MFYPTTEHHGLKHNPFKALIAPRPIGWISTVSADGVHNLAPYSFFNAVADSPPILIFCPNGQRPTGGRKDTLNNIRETGQFVFNLCTYELRDQMNLSAAHVDASVDEFAHAGLTALDSNLVAPKRVGESPVHMECELLQIVELPSNRPGHTNNTVFGRVVGIHIDDKFVEGGMVSTEAMQPLARLGYMEYAYVNEVFSLNRPD